MSTSGWGALIRSSDQMIEVDELGSELSLAIHCAVHYPAYNKHMFECTCGVLFPVYIVRTKDWDKIRQKHVEERELIKA